MRIREGDLLEIYTDKDGCVIFRKYNDMPNLRESALKFLEKNKDRNPSFSFNGETTTCTLVCGGDMARTGQIGIAYHNATDPYDPVIGMAIALCRVLRMPEDTWKQE